MKTRILRVSIGSVIFLLMIMISVSVLKPAYDYLSAALDFAEQKAVELIREKTGLSVAYESMSPSIFAGINIKGIVVSDAASGKKLAEIKKATLSYDFFDFFAKKLYAIQKLILNGITIEFDAVKDYEVIKKLAGISEIQLEDESEEDFFSPENLSEESNAEKPTFTLKGKTLRLPFDVQLKNISIHYADEKNDVIALLKDVVLEKAAEEKDGIIIKTSGRIEAESDYVKSDGERSVIAAAFSVSGTIFEELEGSSAVVRLNDTGKADYSFSRIDFFVNYSESVLSLRTMRTILPISFLFEVDFSNKSFRTALQTEKLDPLRLVKVKNASSLAQKLSGSSVSGIAELSSSFDSNGIIKDSLAYSLIFGAEISEDFLGAEQSLFVDVIGNASFLNINKLAAEGAILGSDFSGEFDLETLQPSGIFSLDHFVLPNGGVVQTEVYIDKLPNGFMCFAPQLFLDDRSLTALQFTALPGENSIDFEFEFDDYFHADYERSCHILVDGSFFTGAEKLIQASVEINDLFADSAILTAAFFLDEENAEKMRNLAPHLSQYIFTDEMYLTSNFKTFSFNAPYCVFANTKKEREIVVFAADGSNQTINLSRFDLQYGNNFVNANISLDFGDSFALADSVSLDSENSPGESKGFSLGEFSFFGDIVVNAMPYSFSGNYAPGWIGVTGDYNLVASLLFDDDDSDDLFDRFSGTIRFDALPLAFGKNILTISTNSSFTWNETDGIALNIMNFELEEPSGNLEFRPRFAFSGSANRYGFMFDTLAYSDSVSLLDGRGSVVWNLNGGIFDSIHLNLDASSPLNSETLSLKVDFTNPGKLPLSVKNLRNDFYLSAETYVRAFPMARILNDQTRDNTVTASLLASGTVNNPFITFNVENLSVNAAGYPCVCSGIFSLDDSGFNALEVNASWTTFNLKDGFVNFNPTTFSGSVSAEISGALAEQSFNAPIEFDIQGLGLSDEKSVQSFTALLKANNVSGTFFPNPFSFSLSALYTPGRLDLMSEKSDGFSAYLLSDGTLSAKVGGDSPFKFSAFGKITQSNLSVDIRSIQADLGRISQCINIPHVSFSKGNVTGALRISGLTTDPEFTGALNISKPECSIPMLSKKTFRAEKILAIASSNQLAINPTEVSLDKGRAYVGAVLSFNRWMFDSIDVSVKSIAKRNAPLDMVFPPFVHFKGNAFLDLNITAMANEAYFSGNITGENSEIEILTSALQAFSSNDFAVGGNSAYNYIVDLNLTAGQKVQVVFNPLLRGLVYPDTQLGLSLNTESGEFALKGDISLRGGEIVWLNRNFYMKEGRIVFNESQDNVDPHVTVRAETKERDERGSVVTIILSALNQPVTAFNPSLSASPAKSEKEIMELFGQVISADSDSAVSLAMAGGDYLVQSTVMRGIENSLRELLNFDIFSIRMNILQNAVEQSANRDSTNKQLTFSNFFDNSTVYIGKYLGNALYVDALMNWIYDETKIDENTGGLVFQPEFGLEMESPFVNIRLGVAPDFEAIQNSMLIPSTSITLSWKYDF